MNELAVQAANGTNETEDRNYINEEMTLLKEEITRTANDTTFNKKNLLNGTTTSLTLHVGTEAGNTITFALQDVKADTLGVSAVDITTSANARTALGTIDTAIQSLSSFRAKLGAVQNRLEHTINNLDNVVENTTAAESQIRDTDMATEMVKYSNNNILAQAGQAMLAQSNQANQGVLSLLQ